MKKNKRSNNLERIDKHLSAINRIVADCSNTSDDYISIWGKILIAAAAATACSFEKMKKDEKDENKS